MKIIDDNKSLLENLYLLSGPIIAVFGFYIFKQIKLAKEQINIAKGQLEEAQKQLKVSSKRDSIKLAAEQIHYFMNDVIPIADDLYEDLKKAGVKKIKISTKEFNLEDIFKVINGEKLKEYNDKLFPFLFTTTRLLNALETFATYFIQEVADERVAYQAIGPSFCNIVHSSSFELCKLSKYEHKRFFTNIIKLYNLWSDRLESEGIKLEKENVEKEFKERIGKIDETLQNKDNKTIKPLGTE